MAIIYTDCSGIKRDAIEGVFKAKFKIIKILNCESLGGKTPTSLDSLIISTKDRLKTISEKKVLMNSEGDYHATIQRGFYFTGTLWHLIARVGISRYPEKKAMAFTSSVPIPLKASKLKTQNPTGNIKDFLEQEYPDFNKEKISMFAYLTGEDEKMWFQQPLRFCLREIMR